MRLIVIESMFEVGQVRKHFDYWDIGRFYDEIYEA